jgi:flagellar basal-body rod protein FlgB
MLKQLEQAFQFDETALRMRAQRQQILASNIANADTPNYKARDFDFATALNSALRGDDAGTLNGTSPGHMGTKKSVAQDLAESRLQYRTPSQDSIDGNTVDMDQERGAFADNAVRYEAALSLATSKIRTMLSAVQG